MTGADVSAAASDDLRRLTDRVSVFSMPSHDENASLTKQGLSAASPHTIALFRQDCCVPGSRWSASSLRTSRRLSYWATEQAEPFRRWGAVRLLKLYCSDARAPEPIHGAHVAAAPNVLFDQSKIVSRDLHRQIDSQTGQVFVQDRFLSRDNSPFRENRNGDGGKAKDPHPSRHYVSSAETRSMKNSSNGCQASIAAARIANGNWQSPIEIDCIDYI
jgi:hypothetical protein